MIESQTTEYSSLLRGWAPPLSAPWYAHMPVARPMLPAGWYTSVKRLLDLVLVALLLIPVLILLALCAAAIWLESPGPVFFTQRRTGQYGRRFKMLKLRTMVADAETLKARYAHLNVLTPPDFKIPNDPRTTRVGRFLRRTSLDELPQVFNVLSGDMSIVGPRPTSFRPESYKPWQWERLAIKPGLTGLWQVVGRSNLDFDDRCRLDIYYVRNSCIGLDVAILIRTIGAVCSGRGAS